VCWQPRIKGRDIMKEFPRSGTTVQEWFAGRNGRGIVPDGVPEALQAKPLRDVTFDEWGQLGLALEAARKDIKNMIRLANHFRSKRIRPQLLAGDGTAVIILPESQVLVIPTSEPE
jgi:hypothetical protein